VLNRIFASKMDQVTGGWRKPHNKELHDLYFSSSIIGIMKSRGMRWEGHVAQMGRKRRLIDYGGKARGKGTTARTLAQSVSLEQSHEILP
jgi:hypothetical protein